MSQSCRIRSCAKLILSGEHSVSYGGLALGIHVPLYLDAVWHPAAVQGIMIHDQHYTWDRIRDESDYLRHHPGALNDDLILVTLDAFFKHQEITLDGYALTIDSHIPRSYGLGSSSALILALLKSCLQLTHQSISDDALWAQARAIEDYQHGRSSGFDLALIAQECALCYDPQSLCFTSLGCPDWTLALVFSGPSASSTQDCVQAVAQACHAQSFWTRWRCVTQRMYASLQNPCFQTFEQTIRENHRLLMDIGVVPRHVAQFIEEWERYGRAGKVCGSGSVLEGGAGALLMTLDQNHSSWDDLEALCREYGYAWNIIRLPS